ncbi:sodium-dependent proline transporter-like isoform X1 [Dermacentor albipictus]|uniref:sodium-dependent proline transporter-like isoform X1 n=1 Tax=Dermacentor albipictus TaxID=60249 RepID=UPI0031FD6CC7
MAEPAEPVVPVEPVESAEPVETAKPAATAEPAVPTKPAAAAEPVAAAKPAAAVESPTTVKPLAAAAAVVPVASPPDDGAPSGTPERQKWGNKVEFILSCIGMSVGLGNIWRFPYMAYANGGAAFLIPYTILMITVGKPMYYLELVLGQFQSLGQTHAFNCFPLSKGVGVCMTYACFFICLYFNILLAYAMVYMVHSFKSPLPWSKCEPEWADSNCFVRDTDISCRAIEHDLYRVFGPVNEQTNTSVVLHHKGIEFYVPRDVYLNLTRGCTNATQTAAEQFFYKSVLNISSGIGEPGKIKLDLTVSLFFAWVFVCIALLKGIKTSGKIVYFTAPAPYFILTVLLIRGLTLPGAGTGIRYLFIPDWEKVLSGFVWQQACQQIFYSLGASMGTIICLGSFNDFRNDLRRDIMIITMADFFTSLSGALVVFAVLGNMAHNLDLPIASVAEKGHGLAFVAYPEAASLIPGSNIWAFAFFLMLLLLAVDSQFAMFESFLVPLKDEFKFLRKYPATISIVSSGVSFLLGISMTTQGGLYVLNLIDTYIGGMILPIIAVMELYTVCWFYGPRRISLDVEYMLGSPPGLFLKTCWVAICPFALTVIVARSIMTHGRTSDRGVLYPLWADIVGVLFVLLGLAQVPIFAYIYAKKMNFDWAKCLKPAHDWGPQDPDLYVNYIRFVRRRGIDRSVSEAHVNRVEAEEDVPIASTQVLISPSAASPRAASHESLLPFSSGTRSEPLLPPSVFRNVFIMGMPSKPEVPTEDEVSVVTAMGTPKGDPTKKESQNPKA